jgi:hypothetical protein
MTTKAKAESQPTHALSTPSILQITFTGLVTTTGDVRWPQKKVKQFQASYFKESLASIISVKLTKTRRRTSRNGVLTSFDIVLGLECFEIEIHGWVLPAAAGEG